MAAKYKYLTLKQIVDEGEYPFTMGQLRDWIIRKEKTGIGYCIKKIGKRLYIRQDLFDEWLETVSEETNG